LLKLLQEKDIEIFKLGEIIETIPRVIKEGEERIFKLKNVLLEKTSKLENIKKEFRHKERELKIYEDKIRGFKSRIYEIKTKKELDALEDEIKKMEDLKEKCEQDCLLLMDKIDIEEKEVERENREFKIKEDEFLKTKGDREKELKGVKERQTSLISERGEIAGKLEGRILELYETIRRNKDNIALAKVSNDTCSVCQMSLRPQIINEIREGNEIIRCESCLRILYI